MSIDNHIDSEMKGIRESYAITHDALMPKKFESLLRLSIGIICQKVAIDEYNEGFNVCYNRAYKEKV